jgi:hypothetical protein
MVGSRRRGLATALLAFLLVGTLALAGCSFFNNGSSSNGDDNRSASRGRMSEKDASADCLSQLEELIASSDADRLVAAFSDEARSSDPDLQAQAEELMGLLGGGTMSDQQIFSSRGGRAHSTTTVMSRATVTSPDGSRWQIVVTDRTKDNDDSSCVGIRELQVIPNTDWDAPDDFGWHNTDPDMPAGIRLITTWDGWDPSTNNQL